MKKSTLKERPAFQSVIFSLDECISSLNALKEVNKLYKNITKTKVNSNGIFTLGKETLATLLGITRDCFCVRVANLFNTRRDGHSLKKYFNGDAIDKLEKHPLVIASIDARNNNIAHLGKIYTKWPEIEDILLATDLKDLLEGIKLAILIDK